MDNSEQLQKINKKLQTALEKQVETIESATDNLLSGISSDNSKFVDELGAIKANILSSVSKATSGGNIDLDIDKTISLSSLMGDMGKVDNLNMVLAFKFLKVKSNILKSIDKATKGGNLDLDIDKTMSLSDLLGESPNLNIVHAFRWLRIKKNILKKVEKATESVELEIDPKMSLNDVLGSTPDQDILTKTRFFLIRQGLLNRISKAAKDFDPQESVNNITGGLGGGQTSSLSSSAGSSSSVIPDDAVDAIKATSQSLNTLVERSEGDVLQDRENRKEDIGREKKRTKALSALGGQKAKGASADSGGGFLGAIGKGGKAIGKGIQGLLTGLGAGLKAISNPKYLIGAGVLIALGTAMFITGKAFQEFADINWANVGIGIGVLVALGAAAFGLSFIAPAIFIGALAIAALGASMIPAATAFALFGKALEMMTPFISAFGDAISTVIGSIGSFLTSFIDSLVQLASAGPGLIMAAGGLSAVSGALILFATAAAAGGILSFFSDDPVGKFIELGKVAPDLATAAGSIDKLSESIQNFDAGEPDKLEDFVDQIKKLSKLKLKTVAKVMQHISEISGTASASANVLPSGSAIQQTAAMTATAGGAAVAAAGSVPSDSPVVKSAVPSLEQKSTPNSGDIKDDGFVTKEYIEASLSAGKAKKDLETYMKEGPDFESVQRTMEELRAAKKQGDDSIFKRVYANEKDQAGYDSLHKDYYDKSSKLHDEEDKITGGDEISFAMKNLDPSKIEGLSETADGGRQYTGSKWDMQLELIKHFGAAVERAKSKQMQASKPQSNSVEELEKSSGNQLDMASRQNESAKTSMKMGADSNVQVVNNKQGDTNQVNNTTINSDSHVDRTADFLVPAF